MKLKEIDVKNLSEEYKRLLISRLAKQGIFHEKLLDMSMGELEVMYGNILSKQTRTVFMGELCHNCGKSVMSYLDAHLHIIEHWQIQRTHIDLKNHTLYRIQP